jgi:hypothetical protein
MYKENHSSLVLGSDEAQFRSFVAEVSDEALLRVGIQIVAGSVVSTAMVSCCLAAPAKQKVSQVQRKSNRPSASVRSRQAA